MPPCLHTRAALAMLDSMRDSASLDGGRPLLSECTVCHTLR